MRGEVERIERIPYRILFIAPGHHIFDNMGEPVGEPSLRRYAASRQPALGGPLGDDSYAYEVEEGSVEMHCSLLFKFLVEMVRKVLHLTLIFLDRNEEMAICFANALFMAGINYEVERDPTAETQVALFHLRVECPDGSVHEVTEPMHLDGMDAFIKHIETHPDIRFLASCRTTVSDDHRREILRTVIFLMQQDESNKAFHALPHEALKIYFRQLASFYESVHLIEYPY